MLFVGAAYMLISANHVQIRGNPALPRPRYSSVSCLIMGWGHFVCKLKETNVPQDEHTFQGVIVWPDSILDTDLASSYEDEYGEETNSHGCVRFRLSK